MSLRIMLPTYSCVSEQQQFLQTLLAGKTRGLEAQQQVSASVYEQRTATKTARLARPTVPLFASNRRPTHPGNDAETNV